MAPPLTLESNNRIVYETVYSQLVNEKAEPLDVTLADFNQVLWHLTSDGNNMTVSVSTKCWSQVGPNGGDAFMKKVYGPMLTEPEPKYDVTISFSVAGAAKPEDAKKKAYTVSRMSRHVLAGVCHMMFDRAAKREPGSKLVQIDYRAGESVWLKQDGDRVTVIFGISFDDPDDIVIGRVFLTEVGKLIQGAPACTAYLKDPPSELSGIRGLNNHGYVSFIIESRHYAPAKREHTIDILMSFRNYLNYHIKCSKAYLHIRMRTRVETLLQVLNRAKQETNGSAVTQAATTTGAGKRTFVRRTA